MPRRASKHPTELELEILKILWAHGPLTVKQVREELAAFRDLAPTSVITVMNIMVKKKYLAKRKQAGSYEYRPRVAEGDVAGGMLTDVVDRAFRGSTSTVVQRLLETSDLDEAEIERIRAILDEHNGSKGLL